MKKIFSNDWVKSIIIIIITSIICLVLMCVVYTFPTERMAENVAGSKETLLEQNDDFTQNNSGYFNYYDTGTNIIMLHEVIYPNTGHIVRDAMLVPAADYYKGTLNDWIDTLYDKATMRDYGESDYQTYGRYWHGYLVFLKPLFLLFGLNPILWINTIVLIVLTMVALFFMYKRIGRYTLAFLATIVCMNPTHVVRSFQLSACYYAMIITLIIIAIRYRENEKKGILLCFVIDGMLVAFLDFLTYPLVALCIPLLLCVILNKADSLKSQIFYMARNTGGFLIGYGGLWLLKWIYASVLSEENIILDGIQNTLHRVGMEKMSEDVLYDDSPIMAIKLNLQTIANYQTLIIIIVCLIIALVILFLKKGKITVNYRIMISALIIAVSPVLWYIVVHNHCALHPHLEWREWVIAIGATFSMLLSLKGDEIEQNKRN